MEELDESESEEEEGSDDDAASDIEERLATSRRRRFLTSDCLFCSKRSPTTEDSLKHMTSAHSFFIPDRELLVDLPGLLSYLGEKVLVGNICLYCPGGAREFGDVDSVRKHMVDKGHCKIAFDTDEDRAELADFFSFEVIDDDEAWEDMDEEGDQTMHDRARPVEVWMILYIELHPVAVY
jgi:pre-60S factor REI1